MIKNKNNIIESINEKKTNNEEFFQIEKYFNKKTLIFFSPKIELPLSSYCSYFPIKNNFKVNYIKYFLLINQNKEISIRG